MTDRPVQKSSWLKRILQTFLLLMLFVVIVGAAAAGLFWYYLNSPDPDWQPPDPQDPAIIQQSDAFKEQVLKTTSTLATNPTPQRVTIKEEQANAWITYELPKWIQITQDENEKDEGHILDQFQQPHLRFKEGYIKLMGIVNYNGKDQKITVILRPQHQTDHVDIVVDGLYAGRIPLPRDRTLKEVAESNGLVDTELLSMAEEVRQKLAIDHGQTDQELLRLQYGNTEQAREAARERALEKIQRYSLKVSMDEFEYHIYKYLVVKRVIIQPGQLILDMETQPQGSHERRSKHSSWR